MCHRLTRRADADITRLLQETLRAFGPRQVQSYAALLDRATAPVTEAPTRASSWDRSDLAAGLRSFHVSLASGRKHGSAHVVYFTVADRAQHGHEVVILKFLYDRMEPHPGFISETGADGMAEDDPVPSRP